MMATLQAPFVAGAVVLSSGGGDLSRVGESRRNGAVLPFAHWPESEDVPVQSA